MQNCDYRSNRHIGSEHSSISLFIILCAPTLKGSEPIIQSGFFQLFVVVSSLLVAGCSGQLRDPKSIPDDESRTRVCEEGEGLDQTTPAPDALPALARGSLNPAANAGAFRQVPKPPLNLRVLILNARFNLLNSWKFGLKSRFCKTYHG